MLAMIYQLQQGDLRVWSDVLRRHPQLQTTSVIDLESLPLSAAVSRYTLTLSDHTEPITLLLCDVASREAHFYESFGGHVPLVPTCWHSEHGFDESRSWIVIDEVANHYDWQSWPNETWDQVVGDLAQFHARYWELDVDRYSWLAPRWVFPAAQPAFPAVERILHLQRHEHPATVNIAEGVLAALHHFAVEGRSLLNPLFTSPHTLLHGAPTPDRWQVDLLGDRHLIEWKRVSFGSAVLDVAALLETAVLQSPSRMESQLEELVLDSYFVQLARALEKKQGCDYEPRWMRRHVLPAAQCWYILMRWLPRLVYLWQSNSEITPELEEQIGRVFERLLKSYKLLTMPTPMMA